MSSRSGELFDHGLDFFTAIITQLGEDDSGPANAVCRLDRSRCAWSSRDLDQRGDQYRAGPAVHKARRGPSRRSCSR